MDNFEFNAPRFINFHSPEDSDEEAEKYFDVDHECDGSHLIMAGTDQHNDKKEDEEEIPSSEVAVNVFPESPKTPKIQKTPKSRKTDCGILIKQFDGLFIATPLPKSHTMETRLDKKFKSPALALRNRSILRVLEENTENDINVRKRKKSTRTDELPEKYLCMAEAIEKFQKATPARFHSRPRNMKINLKPKKNSPLRCTIPLSPHLKVLQRNRPINALSRQQIEEMEVEEMKKYQIKARPLNGKIFKPPNMSFSQRSHTTEFKPFNLTEFKKKTQEPLPTVVKFTARPIPKGLLTRKEDRKNTSAPNLLCSNSNIPSRLRVPVCKTKEKENKPTPSKPVRKGPITTHPFSFYERDKMLLKKKEEKIKEALEEEKKAREFHANPLPNFSKTFQEKPTIIPTRQQPFHLSADDKGQAMREKWEKKIEEEKRLMKEAAQFKARPPTVLSQKPFVPIKAGHQSLEVPEIHLNTESRAKERAVFDMNMKIKEEHLEKLKMEKQQELERKQESEVAYLRKKIVHKANPVRHYKTITIHPADRPLTLPITPQSIIEK